MYLASFRPVCGPGKPNPFWRSVRMSPTPIQPPIAAQVANLSNAGAAGEPSGRWAGLETVGERPARADEGRPILNRVETLKHYDIDNFKVDVAETIGQRRTQEDAFFVTTANPKSADAVESGLKQAFRNTHELTKDNRDGSTATVAVVGADKTLTFAHLGDSPAALFVLDGATREVHYKNLLTEHTPKNESEKQQVIARVTQHDPELAEVAVRNGRIAGSLAVSRAFGDAAFDIGLGREPEITRLDLAQTLPGLKPGDRVFLCVSCDGLTENSQNPSPNIHADLADNLRRTLFDQGPDAIAENLVKEAFKTSLDNITAMVVEIPMSGPQPDRDLILGIADGHGGPRTARQVAENLEKMLSEPTTAASRPETPETEEPNPAMRPLGWAMEVRNREVRQMAAPRVSPQARQAEQQHIEKLFERTLRGEGGAYLEIAIDEIVDHPHLHKTDVARHAVSYAAQFGDEALLRKLAQAGVNLDLKDKNGYTSLQRFCWHGKDSAVANLIAAGCNVNAAGREGFTALHVAARQGNLALIKQLVAAGADRKAKSIGWGGSAGGLTALDVAKLFGHEDCLKSLKNSTFHRPVNFDRVLDPGVYDRDTITAALDSARAGAA